MRAVVSPAPLPADDPGALVDADVAAPPAPRGRDLLVRVQAVSVNPLDTKMRMDPARRETLGEPCILGWDAAGTVEAVGVGVTLFKPGDEVYYAGSVERSGTNAELHVVDERIVAHKPATLDFAQAAAMPLTAITAYEAVVDRLALNTNVGGVLLVIGAAGGVGSMAIQIARTLGATVVATASRPESAEWCRALGADHVIDHREPLREGLDAIGVAQVDAVFTCADLAHYWTEMVEVVRPHGRLCTIVTTTQPLDLARIHQKCVSLHFEAMFARSRFETPDMVEQHRLLQRVATWVDQGRVKTTASEDGGTISAANLRAAHQRVEARATVGKIVLSGWSAQ